MKPMQNLIIGVAVLAVTATGCGKDEAAKSDEGAAPESSKTKEPAKPEKPIELTTEVDVGKAITDPDDTRYQGLKVKAPEGSTAEAALVGVQVKMGDVSYEISFVLDDGDFVATAKEKASKDQLDKLVAFHVDTREAILWESASELGGDNNFKFAAVVKVGDKMMKCANEGYGHFTRAQAEALLKSCQTLTR